MTKEYIGEIEIEDPFKSWFTDLDFYKWLAGFFGAIVVWCSKLSIDFLFKRNKDLDNVKNEVHKQGIKIDKIERSLIVTKSDGSRVSLAAYVQEINHKMDNHDIGEASALQLILDEIKILKDNQEIKKS